MLTLPAEQRHTHKAWQWCALSAIVSSGRLHSSSYHTTMTDRRTGHAVQHPDVTHPSQVPTAQACRHCKG